MHLSAVVVVASLVLAARPLVAQSGHPRWHARLAGGWASFGSAASTDSPVPGEVEAFGVGGGFRWGAGIGRRLGVAELSLDLQTGNHAVEARDPDSRIGLAPAYTLTTAALTLGYPVWRPASGARVSVLGGPLLSIWTGDFTLETQLRLGAMAGIGVTAPLAGHLALDARGTLSVSGSPLTDSDLADLESSYDRSAYVSPGLEVGLRVLF